MTEPTRPTTCPDCKSPMETLTEQQLYCEPCDLIRMTFETGGNQHYFYRPDHGQTLLVTALRQARAERDATLADNAALIENYNRLSDRSMQMGCRLPQEAYDELGWTIADTSRFVLEELRIKEAAHPGAPLLTVVAAVEQWREAVKAYDASDPGLTERTVTIHRVVAAQTALIGAVDALRGRKEQKP